MNINEQFEAQQLEIAELKSLNNSLEHINQGLVDAINQSDDDGKHPDIVWLTRDELKDYSAIQQSGGINSVKSDAIEEFFKYMIGEGMVSDNGVDPFIDDFLNDGLLTPIKEYYVDKLRGENEKTQ